MGVKKKNEKSDSLAYEPFLPLLSIPNESFEIE